MPTYRFGPSGHIADSSVRFCISDRQVGQDFFHAFFCLPVEVWHYNGGNASLLSQHLDHLRANGRAGWMEKGRWLKTQNGRRGTDERCGGKSTHQFNDLLYRITFLIYDMSLLVSPKTTGYGQTDGRTDERTDDSKILTWNIWSCCDLLAFLTPLFTSGGFSYHKKLSEYLFQPSWTLEKYT